MTPPASVTLPVTLPVAPPLAANATAVNTEAFVGPLDVGELDAAELCEVRDRAALLKAGRYGWRVLVLAPEGVRPFDVSIAPDAPPEVARARTIERAMQWITADALVMERCGAAVSTPVLLAVDGGSRFDISDVFALLDGFDVRLLVSDPEPGPPVSAPSTRAQGFSLTMVATAQGWAVLASRGGFPPSEHIDTRDAIERISAAGYPEVALLGGRTVNWSRLVEGLDGLASLGVEPEFGLLIDDTVEKFPSPWSGGTTQITFGQTVPVLKFQPPDYLRVAGEGGRRRSLLMQILGGGIDDLPAGFQVRPDLLGPPKGAPSGARPDRAP